ncbi:MAG: hypothetical protein KJN93_07375 [Alphaproteobacteria bacterium]|nr:hypothetical protein [Alphaproteobacteria bacterium]NNF24907.1 hypothetical protein [Paracoccaceae bacterium]
MSQKPDMSDGAPETEANVEAGKRRGNIYALEICFLAFVGLIVVIAFFEALTYKLVSSRTPFVIMAPLIVLIVIHARRLWRVRDQFDVGGRFSAAFAGQTPGMNKVLSISAWMIGMVLMILAFGHVAGIFLFCIFLTRVVARESWKLSLITTGLTVLFIFGVFEFIFNIELYRGLILRYFLGFRDF